MQRSSRRLTLLILGLIAFVLLSALLYQVGMARLEGKPRTFLQALEWSGETLSTTGYGADARWTHPVMVVFVVLVQFVGVFLVFLIIPVYLFPFLEERFEEKVPRTAPADLSGHVVVYGSRRPWRRCCSGWSRTASGRWCWRPTRSGPAR